MRYRYYNPNPKRNNAIDCVIRAICKVTGRDWEEAYLRVCMEGLEAFNMPNANHVWGAVLRKDGFNRYGLPNECPDCYTVEEFCIDHPTGKYVLATDSHVVAAVDGFFYDTWNSGDKVIDFYWKKES